MAWQDRLAGSRGRALPWLGLVAGCLSMTSAGFIYSFGAYNNALQMQFHLTQTKLDLLITVANLAMSVGFMQGWLSECLTPTALLTLTLLIVSTADTLLYCCAHHLLPTNIYFLVFVYFLYGLGCMLLYMNPLTISVNNFSPRRRGLVTGVSFLAFYAGSTLSSFVFQHFFVAKQSGGDLQGYFLFHGVFQTLSVLVCVLLVNDYTHMDSEHSPLLRGRSISTSSETGSVCTTGDDVSSVAHNASSMGCRDTQETRDEGHKDITGWEMLKTLDFHLITWPFVLTSSVTMVIYTNITSYAAAFGHGKAGLTLSVYQYMASCAGALVTGVLQGLTGDALPWSVYVLPTQLLLALLMVMGDTYLYSFRFLLALDVTALMVEGHVYMVASNLIRDSYGGRHFGRNWGLALCLSGLGAFPAQFVFSAVYDQFARGSTCLGVSCFAVSQRVFSVMLLVSSTMGAAHVLRNTRGRRHGRRVDGEKVELVEIK